MNYQGSLLDLPASHPHLDPLPGRLTRTTLTHGAWVDVLPGWVAFHRLQARNVI